MAEIRMRLIGGAALLAAVILAACGGKDDSSFAPQEKPASTP